MITGCINSPNNTFSKDALKALSTFELPPGFKIELIASEPLISDPVDMTIDARGNMYVVEMHGYPLDIHHTGKVILLSDSNGDGKMDKRTVFADGFTLPTGVMPWKKGVIVTDAPSVYYLKDTTGDGVSDVKKVMLTGFALTNPQYLVNNPVYGLDNWIYLAHERISQTNIYPKKFGDTGQDIYYSSQPDSPRLLPNANGKIVRFRPDQHALEGTSASTQFGQTFDAWGHHFLVVNNNHIYQAAIAKRYLNRNPELLVGSTTESLSDHGNACEVFPTTINPEKQLLTDVGVMTSACGITAYLGGAFPEKYNQNVTFVCEPVSNLVHVDKIKEKGATFTASRILKHKDFLTSTDAWFRPVNLYVGPDGALYVMDYYREIIEHPEWMSKSAIESGKLYNGIKKGRIYRITSSDASAPKWTTQLDLIQLTDKQLVKKMESPNIWWRRNAQRLLVDRNSKDAISPLINLVKHSPSALGRLHALWTLEGMDELRTDLIEYALHDSEPGVRENAIQLAELHLKKNPDLINALYTLKDDNNPKVRFQLLCTLGSINTEAAKNIRQQLLFDNIADKWMRIAALSASSVQSIKLLASVRSRFAPGVQAYALLAQRLGVMVGAGKDANSISQLLKNAVRLSAKEQTGWQRPFLKGLAAGLNARNNLPKGLKKLQSLLVHTCLYHPDVAIRKSSRYILTRIGFPKGENGSAITHKAEKIVADASASSLKRAEAIRLMTVNYPEKSASFLKNIILSDEPQIIQVAALQGLSKIPDATVASFVLKNWLTFTPDIRDVALNTFISQPFNKQRLHLLLQAIQEGKVNKSALGWSRTVILMRDSPDSLKTWARKLLANQNDDRETVIREYKEALQLEGNPQKGKAVYQSHCLVCHKVHGKMGVAFGPDLGTVQNWTTESILINILDPNKSIAHGYEMWKIIRNNGTVSRGIITSETPGAIVLRNQYGRETTIARNNIKSLKSFDSSPMPTDFSRKINKQQMADLITFLKKGNWK